MRKLLLFLLLFVGPQALAQNINGSLTAAAANCATQGACLSVSLPNNVASVAYTVSGTFTGTVVFEVSQDNQNFVPINGYPPNSTTAVTSTTAPGSWQSSISGMTTFRLRCSVLSAGPITVSLRTSTAVSTTRGGVSGTSGGALTGTSLTIQDTAANADLVLQNTTAATSTVNQASPYLQLIGTYWNGTTSVNDVWNLNLSMPNGTNPQSVLQIGHPSGSTGITGLLDVWGASGKAWYLLGNPTSNNGFGSDGSNYIDMYSGANMYGSLTPYGLNVAAAGSFGWPASGNPNAAPATRLCMSGGVVEFAGTTCGSTWSWFKSSQSITVSGADFTCGTGGTVSSCTTATTITGLTLGLPHVAGFNWTFDCKLLVSQATAVTANTWSFQTATTGATNVTAAYDMHLASGTMQSGATADTGTTTASTAIGGTWTLAATGTQMPVHIWGTIEGAAAAGTTFNLQLTAPTVADLVTIYRGSSCYVY